MILRPLLLDEKGIKSKKKDWYWKHTTDKENGSLGFI